jgi:hypothetical protein
MSRWVSNSKWRRPPAELRDRVVRHKRLMSKFDFPLGRAVSAMLPDALASRYRTVEVAEAAPGGAAGTVVELTSLDVEPDFPATTFGPYRATVSLGVRVHGAGAPTDLTVTGEGSSQDSVGRVFCPEPGARHEAGLDQAGTGDRLRPRRGARRAPRRAHRGQPRPRMMRRGSSLRGSVRAAASSSRDRERGRRL